MKKFSDHNEIREVYDTRKYDIFYENGEVKYQVRNLGSTIYCYNPEKNMGMGAIHNFSIDKFYAVERPEPEKEIVEQETVDNEEKQ